MRVQGAIICEKVAKLVTGRAVAYGIYPGWVNVPSAHRGGSIQVSALMHLTTSNAGTVEVSVRVLLPDGGRRELSPITIESDGVHPIEVYLNDVGVPLSHPGPVIVEAREGQGVWKEAAKLVLVPAEPQVDVAKGDAPLTPEVSGLPN